MVVVVSCQSVSLLHFSRCSREWISNTALFPCLNSALYNARERNEDTND